MAGGGHYYLCGHCGTISLDDWEAFTRDDEGELVAWRPDDYEPILRCPACGYDHTDDDADPGVWYGSRAGMEHERTLLLCDRPRYAEEWAGVLAGVVAKGERR